MPSIKIIILTVILLSACSPKYNWREVHGTSVPFAPFTALLPGKADSFSQAVVLNGAPVNMTMTATEVDGVTFAIGSASFASSAAAQSALPEMKMALLRNIGANAEHSEQPTVPGNAAADSTLTLSANGMNQGQALQMTGRLYQVDKRVYQLLIVGNPKKISSATSDTFFTSFKPN